MIFKRNKTTSITKSTLPSNISDDPAAELDPDEVAEKAMLKQSEQLSQENINNKQDKSNKSQDVSIKKQAVQFKSLKQKPEISRGTRDKVQDEDEEQVVISIKKNSQTNNKKKEKEKRKRGLLNLDSIG